jgi:hypothetical protein
MNITERLNKLNQFCECSDPECPAFTHGINEDGTPDCDEFAYAGRLYRIDMYDESGTLMCNRCAEDALESGVFTTDDIDG